MDTNEPGLQELIEAYEQTWLSLTAYDNDQLPGHGATVASATLTAVQLADALNDFRSSLISMGHAGELFGNERIPGAVGGIIGNVMQSVDGNPVYPTVEEQAAHLCYFLIKDHPYVDGNKRSGAYAFIWYLHRAGILNRTKLSASALTALTLFVAESPADQKEKVVRLMLQLIL